MHNPSTVLARIGRDRQPLSAFAADSVHQAGISRLRVRVEASLLERALQIARPIDIPKRLAVRIERTPRGFGQPVDTQAVEQRVE